MQNITVSDFISTVFPEDVRHPHEHVVLVSSRGSSFSWPTPQSELCALLDNDRAAPVAAYVSLATASLDDEGRLYNRAAQFAGQWALVLDDIGTKCSVDDLPEVLREPSWSIESSPGNYQFGYRWDEPIREWGVAKALTELVFSRGAWDGGGGLANKLVRLPAGWNVKAKHRDESVEDRRGQYPAVRAVEWRPDRVFSPREVLAAVDGAVSWDDLMAGVGQALARDPRRRQGAGAYGGMAYYRDGGGRVDVVLEWLAEQGLMLSEGNEFHKVVCPWAEGHSDGSSWASYSPLGAGVGEWREKRGFKCFHDHCSGRSARDFLGWVVDAGGPMAPVADPVAGLAAKWAFDMNANCWVNMRTPGQRIPDSGFRNGHARKLAVPRGGGSVALVTEYALLQQHPGLVQLNGVCYEPGGGGVVDSGEGGLLVNDCVLPHYPRGEGSLDPWLQEFLEYLMPDDWQWFLQHLAAKAQDGHYRGPGVVMTTPTQGTGRGTLAKLLMALWGERAVQTPSMTGLMRGLGGSGFNADLRGVWLVVPEAMELGRGIGDVGGGEGKSAHQQYESLKSFCEPGRVKMEYRRKYGGQWTEWTYASLIICSNNRDVLRTDGADRRFRYINNPLRARGEDYFNRLHAEIDMRSGWRGRFWNYLLDMGLEDFQAYPNQNQVSAEGGEPDEERMMRLLQGMTPLSAAIWLALEYVDIECSGLFVLSDVVEAIRRLPPGLGVNQLENTTLIRRELRKRTADIRGGTKGRLLVRLEGDRRAYFKHTDAGVDAAQGAREGRLNGSDIRDLYLPFKIGDLVEHVEASFEEYEL